MSVSTLKTVIIQYLFIRMCLLATQTIINNLHWSWCEKTIETKGSSINLQLVVFLQKIQLYMYYNYVIKVLWSTLSVTCDRQVVFSINKTDRQDITEICVESDVMYLNLSLCCAVHDCYVLQLCNKGI
jgi:hypothetical protein